MRRYWIWGLAALLLTASAFYVLVRQGGSQVETAASTTPEPSQRPTDSPGSATEPVAAFPRAEGFGSQTVGGRGGKVMLVTNLNDSGPGSLRDCALASGPRICVFRTGGTITLQSDLDIVEPYLTIAGQTAPGGGITLRAAGEQVHSLIHIQTHDVIVRGLRLRPGTFNLNHRALSVNSRSPDPAHNIVVDSNSFSWSGDEVVTFWGNTRRATFSWNLVSESLPSGDGSTGLKGMNLGEVGGGPYTLHHNLFAHHAQRHPNMAADSGVVDYRNNVVFNLRGIGSVLKEGAFANFVANYVVAGPNTIASAFVEVADSTVPGLYANGNIADGLTFLSAQARTLLRDEPYPAEPVTTTAAEVAYVQVLAHAGASWMLACDGTRVPRRDAVDQRIVQSVLDRTRGHNLDPEQTLGQRGYIRMPEDVGGWPVLESGTPCPDADSDGMPDAFERRHGLNLLMDDSATLMPDGYTAMDWYLAGY